MSEAENRVRVYLKLTENKCRVLAKLLDVTIKITNGPFGKIKLVAPRGMQFSLGVLPSDGVWLNYWPSVWDALNTLKPYGSPLGQLDPTYTCVIQAPMKDDTYVPY